MEKLKEINKLDFLKIFFIVLSITFAVPSIFFMLKRKTVFNFDGNLEFCFLLTKNISRGMQAAVYFLIVALMIIVYYFIIRNRKALFKHMKQVYILTAIVTLVFVFVLPFTSSDVFYYMGIGRLSSVYHQNPYYENIKDYVDNNSINLENDTLMR